MINLHTKFEVSKISCNEDMKRNAKCNNSRFKPPFGELTGNIQGSGLDRKRIVDFLLVIMEPFSLALTAVALISEICRNRRFLKGWVTLSANFR